MSAIVWGAAAFVLLSALISIASAAYYLRSLRFPAHAPSAAVTAIMPATGPLPNLEGLIANLSRQSLPPRRLIIAVEAQNDPAYARVRSVQATTITPHIDLIVAGVADKSGQKNANILAALKELGPADEYVLLMDADIRPLPWYVASLIEPLAAGRRDLVNGYRWLTPVRPTVFATLIAAIDRRLAVLPRPRETRLIWGGSIAVTPRARAALDLPTTLAGQVLDDLPIGAKAAAKGLNVGARSCARAPTPIESDPRRLFAFARRQMQFVRIYLPGLWWVASLLAVVDLCARLTLLTAALAAAPRFSAALAALLGVAALDLLSAELRLHASRRLGVADDVAFKMLNRLFALTILPLPVTWTAILFASFPTSRIAWAHVRYRVDSKGRVLQVERDATGSPRASAATTNCLHPAESP
jgi:hypothetical protein